VCVLMGVLSRSALPAILVTLLFWFALFAINSASTILLTFKTVVDERQVRMVDNIATWDRMIAAQKALAPEKQSAGALKNFEFQRDALATSRSETEKTASQLAFWYGLMSRTRAPLPKTDETVDLMTHWLVEADPIIEATKKSAQRRHDRREAWRATRRDGANNSATSRATTNAILPTTLHNTDVEPDDPAVMDQLQSELDTRTAVGIIGSSLAFEAVILAVAAWIFCRRDF